MAMADIIYLTDGSIIKGDIIEINEDNIVIVTKAGELTIDKADIERIEFEFEEEEKDEYAEMRERIKEELEKLGKENTEDVIVVVVVIEKEPEEEVEEVENEEPEEEVEEVENEEPEEEVENNEAEEEVWEVNENEADEENYEWENNNNNDENPQWDNNDNNQDDYDWPEEEDQQFGDNGFVAFNVEAGFNLNWNFYFYYFYSLYSFDLGVSMGDSTYMTLSFGFPTIDEGLFDYTGFAFDYGFAFVAQDGYTGSTTWFELQSGVLYLYPRYWDDYYYDDQFLVTLNLILGYDYRFGSIELVNEAFINLLLLDEFGFGAGFRFGLRFYY
jgi:hypothetical protein